MGKNHGLNPTLEKRRENWWLCPEKTSTLIESLMQKLNRRWSSDVKLLHRLHRLGGASAQADASSAASKRMVLTPREWTLLWMVHWATECRGPSKAKAVTHE